MKDNIYKDFLEEYKAYSKLKDFKSIAAYLVLRNSLYDEIRSIDNNITIFREEEFKDEDETFFDLVIQHFGGRIGVILTLVKDDLEEILKIVNNQMILKTDLEAIILVRKADNQLFEAIIIDTLSEYKIEKKNWIPLRELIINHYGIHRMRDIPKFAPIHLKYDKGFIDDFKAIFLAESESFWKTKSQNESLKEFYVFFTKKQKEISKLIESTFMNEDPDDLFNLILKICEFEGEYSA